MLFNILKTLSVSYLAVLHTSVEEGERMKPKGILYS